MKIRELFDKKIIFSLEVFPPKKTSSVDVIYKTLEELGDIHPDFISVTFGAGGSGTAAMHSILPPRSVKTALYRCSTSRALILPRRR